MHQLSVAIGPAMSGWGSWEWVGEELQRYLAAYVDVVPFAWEDLPKAEVVIAVKHLMSQEFVDEVASRSGLVFLPVDRYQSPEHIQAEHNELARCDRVVVMCRDLIPYLGKYARVDFLDHPWKYALPAPQNFTRDGFILWTGVRTNLGPLIDWCNRFGSPAPLKVLTNPENPTRPPSARSLGFSSTLDVEIIPWSAEQHFQYLGHARAAIDIKGLEFWHQTKPATKAVDFLIAGLPTAVNPQSSPFRHLAHLGFELADPRDPERWFSREYYHETLEIGNALRTLYHPKRIAFRLKDILEKVTSERRNSAKTLVHRHV